MPRWSWPSKTPPVLSKGKKRAMLRVHGKRRAQLQRVQGDPSFSKSNSVDRQSSLDTFDLVGGNHHGRKQTDHQHSLTIFASVSAVGYRALFPNSSPPFSLMFLRIKLLRLVGFSRRLLGGTSRGRTQFHSWEWHLGNSVYNYIYIYVDICRYYTPNYTYIHWGWL